MKLIIKEYLASLKERGELDAILPDLLSEIGFNVFSSSGRGTRQDGVDVAATGCLNGDIEKVYLFSIKAGDLTRTTWDSAAVQSLRPSLNEIIDSYIPNRLPSEHKDKPIVICLCFGGEILEQVRTDVEGYTKSILKNGIEVIQWNGDKLAELILSSFLREDLLPKSFRSMLRKSLALLDEPEASYKHFADLIKNLIQTKTDRVEKKVTVIRQINICLWILFAWCREANNIEAAYLSSELTLLHAWEIAKPFLGKKTRVAKDIFNTVESIRGVYQLICTQYLESKILPFTDKRHALSSAVKPSCKVDVNLKLFDVLGRVAMGGIWTHWQIQLIPKENIELRDQLIKEVQRYFIAMKQLISNNPILLSPYKDDQAIEIAIVTWFLALDSRNFDFIHSWLLEVINRVRFNFNIHSNYPCNLSAYYELIEHPIEKSEAYRIEVTAGSVLYPTVAAFSGLFGFNDIYYEIQSFKEESLRHCNFQFWYPDETSEEQFYTNKSTHGATLSNVCVEKTKEDFLDQIFKECQQNSDFRDMSAMKYGLWPLLFIGCRHYRLPIPLHFLEMFKSNKQ
ncbi:hypothetical protein E4K67_11930 [Desulfosporosinus fructosivorans]|uniref:Chemotaxis protein n=2 Tax=Desulfosporosinus fructosivorans TaxID=2018669 RepID=A0A4Z0R844_9FIRM|nr:hypothetical protein E4K67_11930 [Desulfosporosinus fructosivorans]